MPGTNGKRASAGFLSAFLLMSNSAEHFCARRTTKPAPDNNTHIFFSDSFLSVVLDPGLGLGLGLHQEGGAPLPDPGPDPDLDLDLHLPTTSGTGKPPQPSSVI